MKEKVSLSSVLITEDHWADVGGRTIASLKEFLTQRLGESITVVDVEFIDTVEQLRQATFGV